MSYEKDRDLKTRTITVTYSNFRVDHKLVEGTHSVVRVRSNEDENPQSTATFDVEVTWDNGDIASRVGERTREWVEGVGTGFWGDNVYLITGSWTTTKRNGKTISTTITTPLRRELACKFIGSGVKEFEKEDRTASLDFGDGTCDNKAILTLDSGEEKEMNLR